MRITSQDLLMAGWHQIVRDGLVWWSHPKCDDWLVFREAAAILKKRGIDEYGYMK